MLSDHDSFSNDFGKPVGRAGIAAGLDPGGLGFADPPQHTRMRHMLTPHFTRERLKALTPRISAVIDSSLDAWNARSARPDRLIWSSTSRCPCRLSPSASCSASPTTSASSSSG